MIKRALGTAAATASICLGTAATALATPTDDAFLATIRAQGVPIYGEQYVIQLGHNVCGAARRYPSMNIVDLTFQEVTSESEARPYDYANGRVITTSALANYCPEAVR